MKDPERIGNGRILSGVFKPAEAHEQTVNQMLDQLIAWSGALRSLRKRPVGQT